MNQSRYQNNKNEHLNNIQKKKKKKKLKKKKSCLKKKKNRYLRVKNSCLNIGKDRKAINVSINDMKKFEEKEISKRRAIGKKYLKQLAGLIN